MPAYITLYLVLDSRAAVFDVAAGLVLALVEWPKEAAVVRLAEVGGPILLSCVHVVSANM